MNKSQTNKLSTREDLYTNVQTETMANTLCVYANVIRTKRMTQKIPIYPLSTNIYIQFKAVFLTTGYAFLGFKVACIVILSE